MINTQPLCGGDNGWRSNDTSRGMWATEWEDLDWTSDEEDEDDLITIAQQTAMARDRIQALIDEAA